MRSPTLPKIMLLFGVCAFASTASLAAGSHGGHGSHGGGGGGGHSHGGGSHGEGHFQGGGSRGGGGHYSGGSRHSSFSGGFGPSRGGSSGSYRGSGPRGFGSFSSSPSHQSANPGYARGGWSSPNRTSVGRFNSGNFSSGNWSGRHPSSGWGNTSRSAASFGANRPLSSQRSFNNWSGGSGPVSRDFSGNEMRANSSFNQNRPPSAQRNSSNEFSRGSWGSGRGAPAGRVLSSDMNRPVSRASSASWTSSSRGGPDFGNAIRRSGSPASQVAQALLPVHGVNNAQTKSDRPPSARFTPGTPSSRGNSYRPGTSYFNTNRGRSNFGNSRVTNANFTNTSFSPSGSGRFGGSRSFGSERGGFGRRSGSGYGRFGHDGYGYGDFGHGGWYGGGRYGGGWHGGHGGGWYGGGDDLWILGDLFGLALDFGRLAWGPWAYLGGALLDTSVQALSSFDNYDQQASYNPPLCGNYYSDENPGCLQ